MDTADHPVIRALRRSNVLQRQSIDYLEEHGSSYAGVPLPQGVDRWPLGSCVEASEALARRHGWKQIHGWILAPKALVGDHRAPIYHRWNAVDGQEALDASMPDPAQVQYLGVPVSEDGEVNMQVIGRPVTPRPVIPLSLRPGYIGARLRQSWCM